jgi:hypothetical protein
MYAQPSLPVMYASIAAGYLAWAALALWAVRGSPGVVLWRRARNVPAAAGRTTHDATTTE